MDKKQIIVIGFSKAYYSLEELQKLTQRQLFKIYLADSNGTYSYDCLMDFFNDLNMSSEKGNHLTSDYYFFKVEI